MLSSKISNITLYILSGIAVLIFIAFYAGGYEDPNAEYLAPIYTDLVLYGMYGFFALAVVLTFAFGFMQFGQSLKEDPKKAISSLSGMLILALMMLIAWFMGTDAKIEIPSYEGTENEGFWAQFSDMLLYTIYFLTAIVLLVVVGNSALGVFKKK